LKMRGGRSAKKGKGMRRGRDEEENGKWREG
jgi:hypothetical protein